MLGMLEKTNTRYQNHYNTLQNLVCPSRCRNDKIWTICRPTAEEDSIYCKRTWSQFLIKGYKWWTLIIYLNTLTHSNLLTSSVIFKPYPTSFFPPEADLFLHFNKRYIDHCLKIPRFPALEYTPRIGFGTGKKTFQMIIGPTHWPITTGKIKHRVNYWCDDTKFLIVPITNIILSPLARVG